MTGSKEQFMEMRQAELTPDFIPQISKTNAKLFHNQVKERVKETGEGLLEYMELIKFVEKLKEIISGSQYVEGDKEFREMVRDEISKFGKELTTPRGTKFELAETGTKYDYSRCNDHAYKDWVIDMELLKAKIKEREEFLKTVPVKGMTIVDETTGDVTTVYPPSKSSTSNFKVTLPK